VTKGRRVVALILLAAALTLALLGQYYLFRRPEYVWDGIIFLLAAAVCFLLAWRQTVVPSKEPLSERRSLPQLATWIKERPGPAFFMVAGLVLSLVATLLSLGNLRNQSIEVSVALWVSGVVAILVAALWPESLPPASRSYWFDRLQRVEPATWIEISAVTGLTVLALGLRLAALGGTPYTLGGDEAWHGLLARQVMNGELRNPFVMGYMSMPTLFYWPLSWSLRLVGNDMVGLRLPAALAGTATIPFLYLFARSLWGRRTAFLAALFLAGYDYHIHYSRLGANNVWDALFVLLALLFLDRGLCVSGRNKQAQSLILTGLVMGVSVYFYTGARLLPVLACVYIAYLWGRRWLRARRGAPTRDLNLSLLLLLVLAFLVAAGPMLLYAQTHPNEWNARINQVGIIQSGWLEREPELTGKTTLQILSEQFYRSAGAFHIFPDRTVWYGAERPLLDFLAGAFAVLGMAWAVAHWRKRAYFLVLIWFWSVIITGGMLTESPPSSQRLVIAIPAVSLFVAFGLEQTVRLARKVLSLNHRWENLAIGLLALVLVTSSSWYYFAEYAPARRYGSANGETATMIGHYLSEMEGDSHVYFLGAPQIYWKFGTMTFLAPTVEGQDIIEPLESEPDSIDPAGGALFILLPARSGELDWIQQAFPGGMLSELRSLDGGLSFIAYEVQPTSP
jgi:4-amino-4-deoxy-L-arabinose transferase-like glycosyltransferase